MQDQKKTILTVEDEPAMQRILNDKLSESGFDTLQARDGEEGLNLALQKHPDLILLDVLMPKMTGMVMLNKLREDHWGSTVPVIILTNLSPDTDTALQEILSNQPAYYFIKSDIKLDEIVEKIQEVLNPSTQTDE